MRVCCDERWLVNIYRKKYFPQPSSNFQLSMRSCWFQIHCCFNDTTAHQCDQTIAWLMSKGSKFCPIHSFNKSCYLLLVYYWNNFIAQDSLLTFEFLTKFAEHFILGGGTISQSRQMLSHCWIQKQCLRPFISGKTLLMESILEDLCSHIIYQNRELHAILESFDTKSV